MKKSDKKKKKKSKASKARRLSLKPRKEFAAPAPARVYELRETPVVSADREDDELLNRARMQWQFGDWASLGSVDLLLLEHHPGRAELALLAGCAALQLGDIAKGGKLLTSAIMWGGDSRLIFRLLVCGLHNTLGRYHALIGDEEKGRRFLQLAGTGLGGDPKLIGEARQQRELATLPGIRTEKPSGSLVERTSSKKQFAHDRLAKSHEFSLADSLSVPAEDMAPCDRPEIRSYAQNFEDVMLWRALGHIQNGFYIDIGAQHPVIDSVSKAFYEKGWRGIHVEATREYAKLLREDRPDETVIQAAVSDSHDSITFYEIPGSGLSTGDASVAALHRETGVKMIETTVPAITLADIFALTENREIHWMKIDVEGMEKKVIEGWGEASNRPMLLIIESTLPNSRTINEADWLCLIVERGYKHIYFDGVSSYFVHSSSHHLAVHFASGINLYDNFKLSRMGSSGKYV